MMKAKKKIKNARYADNRLGYLMLLPTLLSFAVFLYIPLIKAVQISFYNYSGIGELTDFVGVDNFVYVLKDSRFYSALWNTVKLVGVDLLFSIGGGFLLAYVLYSGIRWAKAFNVALFIPNLISMVVIGCIWVIIYDPVIGPINQILKAIGLGNLAKAWLGSPSTALPAIMVTWIWKAMPYNMLILYANLLKMPKDMIEAADIDGAKTRQTIRYVVLPYLKPAFFSLATLTIANGFKAFDMVWTMTSGGPGGASEVITTYIYRLAFKNSNYGVATAMSIFVMLLLLIVTVIVNTIQSEEFEEKMRVRRAKRVQ